MIEGIEGHTRSHSFEHSVSSSAMTPTIPIVGSLTPDRSSRLQTSKTPHHRTNFPKSYKPPVPPGYEPPPNPLNRYTHPLSDSATEPVTEAFAAAMRGPGDEPSVISEIPFDQAWDHKDVDVDADSQPGRIKPTSPPPRPKAARATTPTELKPDRAITPTEMKPVRATTPTEMKPITATTPTEMKPVRANTPTEMKPMVSQPVGSSTYRSHSPVPGTSPTEIKTSSSYRSSSPGLMAPPDIRISSSYRSPSPVPRSASSPSRSPQMKITASSTARPMVSSTTTPFDEAPARVTPSPTNVTGACASLNERRDMQRLFGPTSPARASPLANALHASDHMDPFDEPPSLAGGYRMSPPRVSVPTPRPYTEAVEDEPSALTGDFSLEKPQRAVATVPAKASDYEEFVDKDVDGVRRYALEQEDSLDEEDDDDSLFDFEERSKRDKKEDRGRKSRCASSEESDDTSQGDHPDSLQQRAQAAWKRKKRLNVAAAAAAPKNDAGQSPVVSFGKDDIVHNYDPHDSVDADDTFDHTTLGGHSMNSLYTKSAESEVEDIIKDIFMIGSGEGTNPGRRKFKHNPRIMVKIQRQSRDEDEITDEETLNTYDDEDTMTHGDTTATFTTATFTDTTGLGTGFDTIMDDGDKRTDGSANKDLSFLPTLLRNPLATKKSPPQKKSPPSPSRREIGLDGKKEEDPLTEAWAFVENKISAVGAALGLESPTEASTQKDATSCPEQSPRSAVLKEENEKSGWDLWQYLLGPASSFCENPDSSQTEAESLDLDVDNAPSLEEDIRLVDLAVQAAMSIHRLNGYEFDSSYNIDLVNDIKFIVVDLALPLGVIFQENEKGCWVTQILPEGSAASSDGNVQVGDQLAAVDGSNAIDMTVDEIAKLIRVKKKEIELTFVRYVGPLRPEVGSVIQEEGYEISAKASPPRKKLTWSPPSSPKQKSRNKVSPVKPNYTATTSTSSPKGILKNNSKPAEAIKSKSVAAAAAQATAQNKAIEPKRRFRLFGRRKQTTQ